MLKAGKSKVFCFEPYALGLKDIMLSPGSQKLRQILLGSLTHLVLHQGTPAQKKAGGSQGLSGPAPEIEMILLGEDQAVAEGKFRADDVVHGPAGARKGVVGVPLT